MLDKLILVVNSVPAAVQKLYECYLMIFYIKVLLNTAGTSSFNSLAPGRF